MLRSVVDSQLGWQLPFCSSVFSISSITAANLTQPMRNAKTRFDCHPLHRLTAIRCIDVYCNALCFSRRRNDFKDEWGRLSADIFFLLLFPLKIGKTYTTKRKKENKTKQKPENVNQKTTKQKKNRNNKMVNKILNEKRKINGVFQPNSYRCPGK